MNYLLDTCVISKLIRKSPAQSVVKWLRGTSSTSQYLSAITLGEIHKGIARLDPGDSRRVLLADWLESIRRRFASRIIPFDEDTSMTWGELMGDAPRNGRPKPLVDAQIAATALRHGMTLVTRNMRDMADFGVVLFNPFEERGLL